MAEGFRRPRKGRRSLGSLAIGSAGAQRLRWTGGRAKRPYVEVWRIDSGNPGQIVSAYSPGGRPDSPEAAVLIRNAVKPEATGRVDPIRSAEWGGIVGKGPAARPTEI
jgi:hypothetical protein